MIKRDTIQRIIMTPAPDGQGGMPATKDYKETLTVAVSIISSSGTIGEFGVQNQLMISVVSNVALDDYINARYEYSGKLFRLMRQVKKGNEYYSVLLEVNE